MVLHDGSKLKSLLFCVRNFIGFNNIFNTTVYDAWNLKDSPPTYCCTSLLTSFIHNNDDLNQNVHIWIQCSIWPVARDFQSTYWEIWQTSVFLFSFFKKVFLTATLPMRPVNSKWISWRFRCVSQVWTKNEGKRSQCLKKNLWKALRNPGELLPKTTKLWLLQNPV